MPVQGTLKANELRIAQLTIDRTRDPVRIKVLAAMVDTGTGDTRAWIPAGGDLWSAETRDVMLKLFQSMENDVARSALSNTSGPEQAERGLRPPGGIAEHVAGKGNGRDEPEAPSI